MVVRNALALHWLWFGAQEVAALQGEEPWNGFHTDFKVFCYRFGKQQLAKDVTTTKEHSLGTNGFSLEICVKRQNRRTALEREAPTWSRVLNNNILLDIIRFNNNKPHKQEQ